MDGGWDTILLISFLIFHRSIAISVSQSTHWLSYGSYEIIAMHLNSLWLSPDSNPRRCLLSSFHWPWIRVEPKDLRNTGFTHSCDFVISHVDLKYFTVDSWGKRLEQKRKKQNKTKQNKSASWSIRSNVLTNRWWCTAFHSFSSRYHSYWLIGTNPSSHNPLLISCRVINVCNVISVHKQPVSFRIKLLAAVRFLANPVETSCNLFDGTRAFPAMIGPPEKDKTAKNLQDNFKRQLHLFESDTLRIRQPTTKQSQNNLSSNRKSCQMNLQREATRWFATGRGHYPR